MNGPQWTDERVEQAAMLWNDNKTAAQIAVIMDVTRNAIIGLAHRRPKMFKEKFSGINTGRAKGVRKPRVRTTPQVRKPKVELVSSPTDDMIIEEFVTPAVMALVFDASRLPFAKSMVELAPCECRWPVTRSGPHLFCAESTSGVYCDHHETRAHPPRAEAMRAAA